MDVDYVSKLFRYLDLRNAVSRILSLHVSEAGASALNQEVHACVSKINKEIARLRIEPDVNAFCILSDALAVGAYDLYEIVCIAPASPELVYSIWRRSETIKREGGDRFRKLKEKYG